MKRPSAGSMDERRENARLFIRDHDREATAKRGGMDSQDRSLRFVILKLILKGFAVWKPKTQTLLGTHEGYLNQLREREARRTHLRSFKPRS